LKDILPLFHRKYPPKATFEDIVPVYLHCFITKEAIENLIEIILATESVCRPGYEKQLLTSLLQKYCYKPKNIFETLKNFDKEYKIPFDVINMDSEITSVFTSIVKIIASSEGEKLDLSCEILINLLKFCPWYVVSVVNLPALIDEQIESFLSWLVKSKNNKFKIMLVEMLSLIED